MGYKVKDNHIEHHYCSATYSGPETPCDVCGVPSPQHPVGVQVKPETRDFPNVPIELCQLTYTKEDLEIWKK